MGKLGSVNLSVWSVAVALLALFAVACGAASTGVATPTEANTPTRAVAPLPTVTRTATPPPTIALPDAATLEPLAPAVTPTPTSTSASSLPGEILVMFKPRTDQSQITSTIGEHGGTVLSVTSSLNVYRIKVPEEQVEEALEGYRSSPFVRSAQRNFVSHPQ